MVAASDTSHDARMTTNMRMPARARPALGGHPRRPAIPADPSTLQLPGHASGVLAAAAGRRAAAHTGDAVPTCGPALACLECALDALAHAMRALGARAAHSVPRDDVSIDARLAASEI